MTAAEAMEVADWALARGGMTPERYAEAKGVTIGGAPARLLLTEDEAAAALAVSPRTLRRLVAADAGLARCRRNLRNAVRYHAADLAEWIKTNPNEWRAE